LSRCDQRVPFAAFSVRRDALRSGITDPVERNVAATTDFVEKALRTPSGRRRTQPCGVVPPGLSHGRSARACPCSRRRVRAGSKHPECWLHERGSRFVRVSNYTSRLHDVLGPRVTESPAPEPYRPVTAVVGDRDATGQTGRRARSLPITARRDRGCRQLSFVSLRLSVRVPKADRLF